MWLTFTIGRTLEEDYIASKVGEFRVGLEYQAKRDCGDYFSLLQHSI